MTSRPIRIAAASALLALASLAANAGDHHYYTWHDGDYYGYELEQSEFSREHGGQPRSMTYAFHGITKTGHYHLTQMNGPYLDYVSCKKPCETVTIVGADRVTIPLRRGTPLWAAVQDMLAGRMAVASSPSSM